MKTMLSPSLTSVCSSPVSSQSTSFTSTRMPGRLRAAPGLLHGQALCRRAPDTQHGLRAHTEWPFMKSSGRSKSRWSRA